MSRLIHAIAGRNTDLLGKRQDRNIAAGLPTHGLRILDAARGLLEWFCRRLGTGLAASPRCGAAPVAVSEAGLARLQGMKRSPMRRHDRLLRAGYPQRHRRS